MRPWYVILWQCVMLPSLQVIILTIIQIFSFMLAAQLSGLTQNAATKNNQTVSVASSGDVISKPTQSETNQPATKAKPVAAGAKARSSINKQLRMFGCLILACFLNSIALVFWLRMTSLAGIRLIFATFLVFFTCMTVMPQSDTFLFLKNPGRIIQSASILGLVVSGSIAISAVPVFWRWHGNDRNESTMASCNKGIVTRFSVSVLVYVTLYLVFGYFVAWQSPELRSLYGGGDELMGFWERVTSPPVPNRVIPFQVLRAIAWTILCVFMIRTSHGGRLRLAIAIALFISVVMNSQLLLPNPIMSEKVRLLHLAETASSNFLFGLICVWIWTQNLPIAATENNRIPAAK